MSRSLCLSFAAALCFMSTPAAFGQAQPPALTYSPQRTADAANPTFIHSGLSTIGGGAVWDNLFADMVTNALGNNYNEASFTFLNCFGGGMFDELQAGGLRNVAYQSAARHDQQSLALQVDKDTPAQSTYGIPFAANAGTANPKTMKSTATAARAGDYSGVLRPNTVLPNLPPPQGPLVREDPQYTSDGAIGDGITLHRNNAANATPNNVYKAVLWGGANVNNPNDFLTNGRGNERIGNALTAAGYVPADTILRTSNAPPAVPHPPVASATTFKGMASAWKELKPTLTPSTQVFFWSNWGHGQRMIDQIAKRKWQAAQSAKKGVAFASDFNDSPDSAEFFADFVQIYEYWSAEGRLDLLPYFELIADVPVSLPSVTIDGMSLPLIQSNVMDIYDDGTVLKYNFRFGIDASAFALIQDGGPAAYTIDYAAGGSADESLDFMMAGLALGDGANGLSLVVPEPASMLGLIGVLPILRRSRNPGQRCNHRSSNFLGCACA